MVRTSFAAVLSVLSIGGFSACVREAPRVSAEPRSVTEGAGQRSSRPVEQPVIGARPTPPPPAQPVSACGERVPSTDRGTALGVRPTTTTREGRAEHTYRDYAVFLAVNGASPMARTAADPRSLRLELTGPASLLHGTPLGLRAEVHNGAASSATVIRSNDGSFEQMREPFVDMYLQNTADQRVYRYSFVGERCRMVNGLERADLVSVASGGRSSAPFAGWTSHLTEAKIPIAGRFRVWLVYRQCNWREAQGRSSTPSMAKPSDLFEGQLVSNAIEIEVQ